MTANTGVMKGAVLGGNVSKSRSPAIHAAAFRALGVTGHYDLHSVDAAGFRRLVARLGAEGYDYLNVTIPHKRAAALLADSASPMVTMVGAANTLIFRRGRGGIGKNVSGRAARPRVRAENTDGYGLTTALGEAGAAPGAGQAVVMLGSGGEAAGALAALVAAGASVRLVARRTAVAHALRRRFSPRLRARIAVVPWTPEGVAGALTGAAALVSTVPADVFAAADATAGLEGIARGTAVLEMAYGEPTPLARFLAGRVRRYQDGIPMLVHQAARAVELVLGRLPPTAPLMRAARRPPRPLVTPAPASPPVIVAAR